MRNNILKAFIGLLAFLPVTTRGQHYSSLNTFSPYTFYALGDLQQIGNPATKSMGGVGQAYWNSYDVNLQNPAAHSAVRPRSFVFDVGFSGASRYLKTDTHSTADNAFNVNNVSILFPIYRGIGFAVSVTPFSSVGYTTKVRDLDQDPNIGIDVGDVYYQFEGDGNISQIKGGLGVQIFKGFSLGADLIYYLGTLNHDVIQSITNVNGSSIGGAYIYRKEVVSKVTWDVGFQWDVWRMKKHLLTIGATYQPKTTLNNKMHRGYTTSYTTHEYDRTINKVSMPQKIAGGLFFRSDKMGIGFDYSYQDWKNAYKLKAVDNVTLDKNQSFNLGFYYTPNRLDIRKAMKRWTYRAGFRYNDFYIVRDGEKIHEMAVSFGVGVPLRASSPSEMSIGIELGQRGKTGTTPKGYQLVQDKFFRISVGFSLFGEDYWFIKQKYD